MTLAPRRAAPRRVVSRSIPFSPTRFFPLLPPFLSAVLARPHGLSLCPLKLAKSSVAGDRVRAAVRFSREKRETDLAIDSTVPIGGKRQSLG